METGASGSKAQGLTRREALKRGVLVGGSMVWAAPAVQVIRMSPAFAQTVSPGPGKPGGEDKQPKPEGKKPGGGGEVNVPGSSTTTTTQPTTTTSQPEVSVLNRTAQAPAQAPQVLGGGPGRGGRVAAAAQEQLPETGIEVVGTAGLAAGLMAAGKASLEVAKRLDKPEGKHRADDRAGEKE